MPDPDVSALFRKIARNLIPFLFVLYLVAYLDRVNVSFAQLEMKQALGIGDKAFGLGAGIFFIGYFLFEVPSNLILARVGARCWLARIMVSWGIVAMAMIATRTAVTFCALRFLLGIAEAGFFPGVILYLTYWFTAAERARAVSLFMTALAVSSVIGSPISGALLQLHGVLAGWQWLFVLEGLPAVMLGVAVFKLLPDGPADARWLSPDEKALLVARLDADRANAPRRTAHSLAAGLANPAVLLLSLLYVTLMAGLYGIGMWLPQILKSLSGLPPFFLGLLTAVPYLVAALGMVRIAAHSDRTGERRLHVAGCALLAAAALVASALSRSPYLSYVALSLAALGICGALGPFWACPTAFLRGAAAAGGIALINSIGNLGGFMGPFIVGAIKERTHGFAAPLCALAVFLAVGCLLALSLRPEPAADSP